MIRKTITNRMKRRKVSQYALAKLSGVSQGAISSFVRDERDMTSANLDKLCKALNLKLQDSTRRKAQA